MGGQTLSGPCHSSRGRQGGKSGADGHPGPEGLGPRNQRPHCSECCSLTQSQGTSRGRALNQPGIRRAECGAEQDLLRAWPWALLLSLGPGPQHNAPLAEAFHPTSETVTPALKFPCSLSSHSHSQQGQPGLALCMHLSQPQGSWGRCPAHRALAGVSCWAP